MLKHWPRKWSSIVNTTPASSRHANGVKNFQNIRKIMSPAQHYFHLQANYNGELQSGQKAWERGTGISIFGPRQERWQQVCAQESRVQRWGGGKQGVQGGRFWRVMMKLIALTSSKQKDRQLKWFSIRFGTFWINQWAFSGSGVGAIEAPVRVRIQGILCQLGQSGWAQW